jgi:endonuclease III
VKNARQSAKVLSTLLRKLGRPREPLPLEDGDPVSVMVMSFLMWDATTTRAATAFKRLRERVVDFNDLRVSMPHEMVEWIGPRFPQAAERCQRLRAALRHTYEREHSVNLDRLGDMGRREIKSYLRSLDGIVPYVADRVTLLCFDSHCVPVDTRLHRSLLKVGVGDETVEISDMASWLARQVKAADAVVTHRALQTWSDKVGSGTARAAPTRAPARKKTTTKKKKKTRNR